MPVAAVGSHSKTDLMTEMMKQLLTQTDHLEMDVSATRTRDQYHGRAVAAETPMDGDMSRLDDSLWSVGTAVRGDIFS